MLSSIALAQDIHYAQVHREGLHLNPALVGVISSDIKSSVVVRNQWASVPVDYLTGNAEIHAKLIEGKGVLSGGILLQYDEAGDAQLSQAKIDAIVGYNLKIANGFYLSAAFQAGYGNRSFNPANLKFDSQFNGDVFDPSLSTEETFDRTRFSFFDLSTGLNLHTQRKGVLGFYTSGNTGVSVHHLNRPEQQFLGDKDSNLDIRITAYSYHHIVINQLLDGYIAVLNSIQGESTELLLGTGARFHFSRKANLEQHLGLYLYYRWGDAVIPAVSYRKAVWEFGLSYDWNISDFAVATNGRGGPEFYVTHTFTKVKPVLKPKSCPVF